MLGLIMLAALPVLLFVAWYFSGKPNGGGE